MYREKATKYVRVRVTKEDRDQGIAEDCYRCPIARALKRAGFREPRVNFIDAAENPVSGERWPAEASIELDWPNTDIPLPPIAIDFIRKFDAGQVPAPFEFLVPDLRGE